MTYFSRFLAFLSLFGYFSANSQRKHSASASLEVYASNALQLPFWLRVNQFGAIPQRSPALVTRLSSYSIADTIYRFFDWEYGIEAFGTLNSKSQLKVIEGYVGLRLGGFKLTVGRKKEIFGLLDTLLSTGSVAWSGNALPVPKLQLSTNGFVEIPYTNQLFAIQGTYSHGWVGEQRISPNYFPGSTDIYGHYVNTYLHQKAFYGRFGNPRWKFNLYGGFNHQAFWGNEQKIWPQGFDLSPLEHYRRVVMGINWWSSKIGNHFGTIDLGARIKGKTWDWFLYRQSIYETGSLLNAFNLDALNGLSITRKQKSERVVNLQRITLEYIYTNDQADPLVPQIGSRNDYFNHYIYLDGWRYKDLVLGTPFAVADTYLKENANNPNFRSAYISNNRIFALHAGLAGTYQSKYHFTVKTSFSRNEGTYGKPFLTSRYQWSSFLSLSKHLEWIGGVEFSGKVALDIGQLYPNNVGIHLNLRKLGFF